MNNLLYRLGSPTAEESSSLTNTGAAKTELPPVGSPRTEITIVAPVPIPPETPTQQQVSRGPRKSVSIVLPDEENG